MVQTNTKKGGKLDKALYLKMEEDFFLKKMKGVKILKKETTHKVKKHPKPSIKNLNDTNTNQQKAKESIKESKKVINTKFEMSFGEINKDLKRGNIKIDRRIDLHGYSLAKAHEKLKKEILKSYNTNKRCMLIITGKGVFLGEKDRPDNNNLNPKLFYGKIKNSIINWINEEEINKYVLTYQDAGIEHGGDGAIFIYLRKKRN